MGRIGNLSRGGNRRVIFNLLPLAARRCVGLIHTFTENSVWFNIVGLQIQNAFVHFQLTLTHMLLQIHFLFLQGLLVYY